MVYIMTRVVIFNWFINFFLTYSSVSGAHACHRRVRDPRGFRTVPGFPEFPFGGYQRHKAEQQPQHRLCKGRPKARPSRTRAARRRTRPSSRTERGPTDPVARSAANPSTTNPSTRWRRASGFAVWPAVSGSTAVTRSGPLANCPGVTTKASRRTSGWRRKAKAVTLWYKVIIFNIRY